MDKFISRKDLEVRHSKSYEMRNRLKELGCEWDGIAKAWIAPSIEVKELCYQILEEADDNSPRRSHFGRCGWDDMPKDLDSIFNNAGYATPIEPAKSVAHTPTKAEAEKICGEENAKHYWHSLLPEEAASLLASGENNEDNIRERLENQGWKSRQISLLLDVVSHFRQHPPIPALDEVTDNPPMLSVASIDPIEMDGSIGVIRGADQKPVAFTITFPYSNQMVNRVKWLPGRKWNSAKKRWEVPIESRYGSDDALSMFPHFQRSPKAQELENAK